jgi:hypothetical protein
MRYYHPEHGYHVMQYGDDIAAMEKAGWRPEQPAATAVSQEAPADTPKRRGRPRKAAQ